MVGGCSRRRGIKAAFACGLAVLLASWTCADAPAVLEVGTFSAATEGTMIPPGWHPLTFPKIARHTSYKVVKDEGQHAVQAISNASASGLTRELTVSLHDYPILRWRWKVTTVLEKGDVTKKEGDDYPARIYITFQYDAATVGLFEKTKYAAYKLVYGQYPPSAAINYIWESHAPQGTIVPNPFTDRVKMIVVESGPARLNRWVDEERNLYDDYKTAFGGEPPNVSGVAIMTDTDNTGESAIAYYGDILFTKRASDSGNPIR